jgi:hypothetical protein
VNATSTCIWTSLMPSTWRLQRSLRTNTVLTLDRGDFRAIHPLSDQYAFRLLPDDA